MFLPITVVLVSCLIQVDSVTRTYYIGAVEIDWDFAPSGNLVNDNTGVSDQYLLQGPNRIGSTYRKIVYREFTNGLFTHKAERHPALGMIGPLMRAEVGDTIVVVFKNMVQSVNRSFSVHPHGVQYDKNAEGALYVDQTTGTDKADDGVPPGQTFRYVWRVLPTFAPTRDDDQCLIWAYHSHVKSPKDVDSGLMGLMMTCKKGTLIGSGATLRRRDVSADFPLYLDTSDETNSWFIEQNLQRCGSPSTCASLLNDNAFQLSNRMTHVNGLSWGNLKGLEVSLYRATGRPAAFYFFTLNRGITSMHFSGQVLIVRRKRVNSVVTFPATFVSAYMEPFYTGYWLLSSRNVDLDLAGQSAYLKVTTTQSSGRKRRQAVQNLDDAIEQEQFGIAGSLLSHNNTAPSLFNVQAAEVTTTQSSGRKRRQAVQNLDDAIEQEQFGIAGSLLLHDNTAPSLFNVQAAADFPMVTSTEGSVTNVSISAIVAPKASRTYYLAIEDYIWDYAPSGQNLYEGGSLSEPGSASAPYFSQGPQRIGGKYKKTGYVQYTDSTFKTRVAREEAEEHLGMLGPVLMAEVGEIVEVWVRNRVNRVHSFYPHGVIFSKSKEGLVYRNPQTNRTEGRVVRPGETTVYRFRVPSLGLDDLPCIPQTYQSAADTVRDVYTGLIGPMLFCSRGQLGRNPKLAQSQSWQTNGVTSGTQGWFQTHAHFFLNFFTINENLSWHLQENINSFATDPASVSVSDNGFRQSNFRRGINGRMYGNLRGLRVCLGDNVAWYLIGFGGEFDLHAANFHGQTLDISGTRVTANVVVTGTSSTLTSVPQTVGNWSVACRTDLHFTTGMKAKYSVRQCELRSPALPTVVTRRYYIAAQEVLWDYAPLKRDLVTGENFTNDSQVGYLFVKEDNEEFIGSTYKKTRYIEYTDSTFRKKKRQTPKEVHLSVLGPIIKAEVGDVIEVVFFNNATRPYSMHPQGVQYEKRDEGAKYQDGAPPTLGDEVPPGQTFTYKWRVPERAGPSKNDPNCVAWMYYSSVDSVKDMASGLFGPLLVCSPNTLIRGTNARIDVDGEFWMFYYVMDENLSWHIEDNVRVFAPRRTNINDVTFINSNRMNTINGRIYGNVNGMVMQEGDMVAWYLLGLDQASHPVHFHGQTFIHRLDRQHRGDVLEVFPSTSSVVSMLCDNPGTWIVHCHLSNHVTNGMEATYTIKRRLKSSRSRVRAVSAANIPFGF